MLGTNEEHSRVGVADVPESAAVAHSDPKAHDNRGEVVADNAAQKCDDVPCLDRSEHFCKPAWVESGWVDLRAAKEWDCYRRLLEPHPGALEYESLCLAVARAGLGCEEALICALDGSELGHINELLAAGYPSIDVQASSQWFASGFSYQDAAEWWFIDNPDLASEWKDGTGLSGLECKKVLTAGFAEFAAPETVGTCLTDGASFAEFEACRFLDAGFSPADAITMKRGIENGTFTQAALEVLFTLHGCGGPEEYRTGEALIWQVRFSAWREK